MARYNHFAIKKYDTVCFGSVKIGEKFRMDKLKDGKRRQDIIMVKTADLAYMEFKNKKEYRLVHSAFEVSSYQKK